jgi:hypothetical protein
MVSAPSSCHSRPTSKGCTYSRGEIVTRSRSMTRTGHLLLTSSAIMAIPYTTIRSVITFIYTRHPPFTHYPFPLRSLVCGGQPSPHKPRLVVSHSTCPPLSSSPNAHSFVLGTAVINTHTHPFFQPNNGTSLLMIAHALNTSNRPAGCVPARSCEETRGSHGSNQPAA